MVVARTYHDIFKAVLAAAFFVSPAYGQSAASNRTMGDICSTVPPIDDAAVKPLIELVLKPGTLLDLSKIPPDTMAKMAALQKAAAERQAKDWAYLCRYSSENEKVRDSGKPQRVVFLGDSITEYWQLGDPAFFNATAQDRGISGQTTAQILLRFYPDVVALRPSVVHIMAGTNDVAGNLGPVSDDTIIANLTAMIDMAQANHIKVVLASIPPARVMSWKPGLTPAPRITVLNQRLEKLAQARGAIYLDYHSRLRDEQNGFQAALANDGVHPNRDGYAIMRQMAAQAISQAERKRK